MRKEKSTHLSDETLMAYLDGQLAPADRIRVERLLACDPSLRTRLDVFRTFGRDLAALFDDHLNAPLPPRLQRFELAPWTDWSKVFDAGRRRKRRSLPEFRGFRSAAASAAILAAGIGIGWLMHGSVGGDGAVLGEVARVADDRVTGTSDPFRTRCRAVRKRCVLF